ncbi:hypothetical protein M5689_003214 [Euphorbia peplus]|nr:hypothetical protein M5689_003214 [Euphorbia peplus]
MYPDQASYVEPQVKDKTKGRPRGSKSTVRDKSWWESRDVAKPDKKAPKNTPKNAPQKAPKNAPKDAAQNATTNAPQKARPSCSHRASPNVPNTSDAYGK